MRRGEWKRSAFTGVELRGKTLGIIGLGKIGMAIADRARALEMTVVGSDPFVTAEAAAHHGDRARAARRAARAPRRRSPSTSPSPGRPRA